MPPLPQEVWFSIWAGVGLFLAIAGIRLVGAILNYVGRVVADHLRDGLVSEVRGTLRSTIHDEVVDAVDARFETMEHNVTDIWREVEKTIRPSMLRIEAAQSKERALREQAMSHVWEAFARLGYDRRNRNEDDSPAEGD